MINEQLLREHLNSYAIHLEKETYEEFHRKLYSATKEKLSTRKKNIYLTVEKTDYPSFGIRVEIKTKIDQVPCYLSFSFNYEKFKKGIDLYFIYDLIKFQPFVMPFSLQGDDSNLTYRTVIPFMVWMSEEDKFITHYCREDYKSIVNKDNNRIESLKFLEGEDYILNIKKYCGSKPEKRYKTVVEARVAAMKMMDRLIEFMEEVAWKPAKE